jgi:hypothetical protein
MIRFNNKDLDISDEKSCTYSNCSGDIGFVDGSIWAYGDAGFEYSVELELTSEQTKKVYEFMKNYYESGFGTK